MTEIFLAKCFKHGLHAPYPSCHFCESEALAIAEAQGYEKGLARAVGELETLLKEYDCHANTAKRLGNQGGLWRHREHQETIREVILPRIQRLISAHLPKKVCEKCGGCGCYLADESPFERPCLSCHGVGTAYEEHNHPEQTQCGFCHGAGAVTLNGGGTKCPLCHGTGNLEKIEQ